MFFEPSLLPAGDDAWKTSDGLHKITRATGPDGWPCIEVTTADGTPVTRCTSLDAALRVVQAASAGASR